ncbi:hypothetical protein [Zoogloea sp. 1C4]|uniref:hypothetical protein n=1 Tax=Zoogloea sp. 1C4 TaxID=2570190 RepID=UPI001291FAA9|nr:hypothetical protein [Zoogloea sp. 1C4]
MKKSLLAKIGAGFLMGSVLAVAPAGAADLYDSLQAFSYDMSLHRSMGSDPYDSMEPTAAGGSQGPVRTDMMKDSDAYQGGGYYQGTYYGWTQWSDVNQQLGPIGGRDTN